MTAIAIFLVVLVTSIAVTLAPDYHRVAVSPAHSSIYHSNEERSHPTQTSLGDDAKRDADLSSLRIDAAVGT